MYLLRNLGRYRPDQYQVVGQAKVPVALALNPQDWQGLQMLPFPPGQRGHPASHQSLPRNRMQAWKFGEFTLAVNLPAGPHSGNSSAIPDLWNLEGFLSFSLRDVVRKGKDSEVTNHSAIAREFCDFLTVATNSYVAVATAGDSPIEQRWDKPQAPPYASRSPVNAWHFDRGSVRRYVCQFNRFANILHWRHHGTMLNAFRCYRLALGLCELSLSTAYFLLVSALEAIAAEFIEVEVSFEDFEDDFRRAFQCWQDKRRITSEDATDLRERLALAEKGRLRCGRRFRTAVSTYLPVGFWSCHTNGTITRENLDRHLTVVYRLRSKFAHEAREFGVEASFVGHDVLPVFAYDPMTGVEKDSLQELPTFDFFAQLTRAVLLDVLESQHSAPDDNPDPEDWMRGRTHLTFPKGILPWE